jgi:uncharacterized membrane protein YccF (DUF307 family)
MKSMNTVLIDTRQNPGCLIQIVWFALVGWWLGLLWIAVAWLFMVTILGAPLGVLMLNKLPRVIALRDEAHRVVVTSSTGGLVQREVFPPEINLLVRAIYFVLIGWWLSALWMVVAYLLCLTVIGLPVGFWMFDRVPSLVSLKYS